MDAREVLPDFDEHSCHQSGGYSLLSTVRVEKTKHAAGAEIVSTTKAQPQLCQIRSCSLLWHLHQVGLEDGPHASELTEKTSMSGCGRLRRTHYLSN